MSNVIWLFVNAVQAVFTLVWSAGWILIALVVRGLRRDSVASLNMLQDDGGKIS